MYVFGGILVVTAIKLFAMPEDGIHPERNPVYRLLRRLIPAVPEYHGARFTIVQDGRRYATPLLIVLLLIEWTDVVFAVDSIPAIFAITTDPFIVFTSNIFAILGLRSLYFAIASLIGRFEYLKVGLALVLVFIGVKMCVSGWVHIHALVSLAVVAGLLGSSMVFSMVKTRRLAEAAPRVPPPSA